MKDLITFGVSRFGREVVISVDVFERSCCLSSGNKMTAEQQDIGTDIIYRCFE